MLCCFFLTRTHTGAVPCAMILLSNENVSFFQGLDDETHTAMFEDFENVLRNVIEKNENKIVKIHLK